MVGTRSSATKRRLRKVTLIAGKRIFIPETGPASAPRSAMHLPEMTMIGLANIVFVARMELTSTSWNARAVVEERQDRRRASSVHSWTLPRANNFKTSSAAPKEWKHSVNWLLV